jgi:hypothetical protein
MSVPLDRLYNFLDDTVDQDIVIYRWWPHGSKNLEDLQPFHNRYSQMNLLTNPVVIMHDQEPLTIYSHQQIVDFFYKKLRFNFFTKEEFEESVNERNLSKKLFRECTNTLNMYDRHILIHSEKNSKELDEYCSQGAIPVYYWSHALISLDWFRYAKLDPRLLKKKHIKHDFLIYNRAWSGTREYRLKFAEAIVENNLSSKCLMGFSSVDTDQHYSDYVFNNSNLKINRNDLENYFFDNNILSSASADYNSNDYNSCLVEVVLETMFDSTRLHLTEKTLRPIACNMPFILAASAGSLEYLKSYGFKTFDNILDEGYDKVTDAKQRLEYIIATLKEISSMTAGQKKKFAAAAEKITRFNQQLFFSKKFYNHIVNEYKNNMQTALEEIEKFKNGQLMLERLSFTEKLRKKLDIETDDIVYHFYKIYNKHHINAALASINKSLS